VPNSYQAKTSRLSPQQAADDADATERRNAEITRSKLARTGASPGKIESEILKGRIRRLRTATIYRSLPRSPPGAQSFGLRVVFWWPSPGSPAK
jgi:hypothetical protein